MVHVLKQLFHLLGFDILEEDDRMAVWPAGEDTPEICFLLPDLVEFV